MPPRLLHRPAAANTNPAPRSAPRTQETLGEQAVSTGDPVPAEAPRKGVWVWSALLRRVGAGLLLRAPRHRGPTAGRLAARARACPGRFLPHAGGGHRLKKRQAESDATDSVKNFATGKMPSFFCAHNKIQKCDALLSQKGWTGNNVFDKCTDAKIFGNQFIS